MQERRFIIDLKDLPVPVMLDAITVEAGQGVRLWEGA